MIEPGNNQYRDSIVKITKKISLSTVEILTILVIITILTALLLPPVQQAVNSGRREHFRDQLKFVALALYQYQEDRGCLPPAVVIDEQGNPIHSWRALLLPSLEQQSLFKDRHFDYRFDEPWNSPHNQQLAEQNPDLFRLETHLKDDTIRNSRLVAIIDDSTYWNESQECRLLSKGDDLKAQILLIEIPGFKGLWNEPSDITLDELLKLTETDSFGIYGAHALYADGHVHCLSPEELNASNLLKQVRRPAVHHAD
jgi:prepilin-type processing-associated H-X9-DG protein